MTAAAEPRHPDGIASLGAWVRAMSGALADIAPAPPPPLPLVRVTVSVEPRDGWVGAYLADGALYLCPVPFVVVKVDRP